MFSLHQCKYTDPLGSSDVHRTLGYNQYLSSAPSTGLSTRRPSSPVTLTFLTKVSETRDGDGPTVEASEGLPERPRDTTTPDPGVETAREDGSLPIVVVGGTGSD